MAPSQRTAPFLLFSCLSFLFLELLHHIFLDVARNDRVLRKFHGELTLTLRRRTQVSGVTEHFTEWNFGFDDRVTFVGSAVQNHSTALVDLTHHGTLELFRSLSFKFHDR